MVSKAIPEAFLRKYERPIFQIQGFSVLGTALPPLSPVIPQTKNYLDVS